MERRNFIKSSALAMALFSVYKTDVFAQQKLLSYNFKTLRNNVGVFT